MAIINNYVLLLLCIFFACCSSLRYRQRTIVPKCTKEKILINSTIGYRSTLITACVDPDILRTLWTKHTVMNSIVANPEEPPEQNYCRNRFSNSHFPGVNMDYLYYYEQWNRGHLAPYGDFQSSVAAFSCDYVNIAPQYPSLNQGAWNQVERSVRKVKNATVFTGTLFNNTLEYPNIRYLGIKSSSVLPVPHFFYKLVIIGNKSVAFVGINDFETLCRSSRPIKKFCEEDMCPKFSVTWANSPIKPIYCCKAEEFLRNVDENERPISVQSFEFLNIVNDTVSHNIGYSKVIKKLDFCGDKLIPRPRLDRRYFVFRSKM